MDIRRSARRANVPKTVLHLCVASKQDIPKPIPAAQKMIGASFGSARGRGISASPQQQTHFLSDVGSPHVGLPFAALAVPTGSQRRKQTLV